MDHGVELVAVLIVSFALAVGAATRMLSARVRAPYTVAMLLIGLVCGALLSQVDTGPHERGLLPLLEHGTDVSPDLILFVFLPALLFESAYSMDVHSFRKSVGGAAVLAVPGMLAATFATAALLWVIVPASWGWSFTAALAFGALISATDPVAVVALLREVGASKRLSTLIEGESLLNDGTAIVVFTAVVGALAAESGDVAIGPAIGRFVVVVAGGLGVGLALAWLASWWIGRTFNDPLVEITLTIVLGYLAMVLGEGVLHVSGVIAVVAAGLWMSGPGGMRLSPEVWQFVHRFWEMLAYMANTLVFFLVGLVIGTQAQDAGPVDALVIVAAWAGIMAIRFALVFAFRPLANLGGDRISARDSVVVAWGGLRGAVSMALALLVAQKSGIEPALQQKLLLITAGVVLLTLLINGTTTGKLLRALGYGQPVPSEELAVLGARAHVLDNVRNELRHLSQSRDFRAVAWSEVQEEVEQRKNALEREADAMRQQLENANRTERAAGYWGQVLNIERQAYWYAFARGMLSAPAVRLLQHEIDLHRDRIARGDIIPPGTRAATRLGGLRAWLERRLRSTVKLAGFEFDNLALLYDLLRGQTTAASRVLGQLDTLETSDSELREQVENTYREYLREGHERIEEMRLHLPEVTRAIETRLAHRVTLNLERDGYEELAHQGVLDHDTEHHLLAAVEHRMKRLQAMETKRPLPEVHELIAEIPLFESFGESERKALAERARSVVLPAGEYLFRQGDRGDSLFLVSHGAMHVLRDEEGEERLVDVLGTGDILGEMALLAQEPRTASIRAATSVTLVEIDAAAFRSVTGSHSELHDHVWDSFAQRRFDNHVRELSGYSHLDRDARLRRIRGRPHQSLDAHQSVTLPAGIEGVFVLTGRIQIGDRLYTAPALIEQCANTQAHAETPTRLVLLGPDRSASDLH